MRRVKRTRVKRTRTKYRNKHCQINGIKFHSKAEAKRYLDLSLLQSVGEISDLKLQVPFQITINNQKLCKYIADFTYMKDGKLIVEDKKGVRTATFNLKKKLMKIVLGIDILVT